jgi:hypothetical protein
MPVDYRIIAARRDFRKLNGQGLPAAYVCRYGIVIRAAETGKDEDAGRTRLTFRYRARVCRVMVESDGNLIEGPVQPLKPRPTINLLSLLDLAWIAP